MTFAPDKPGLPPRDSFDNWLTDLFDNAIGRPALTNIRIAFEEVGGQDVYRIEVKPSRKPIYAQGKQSKDLYVPQQRHPVS